MAINPIQSLTYSIDQLKNLVHAPTTAPGTEQNSPVGGSPNIEPSEGTTLSPDFGSQVIDAVKHVNSLQKTADDLTTRGFRQS